jgi:hypothetical protein
MACRCKQKKQPPTTGSTQNTVTETKLYNEMVDKLRTIMS